MTTDLELEALAQNANAGAMTPEAAEEQERALRALDKVPK